MKKICALVSAAVFFAATAVVDAQTVTPEPTPSSVNIAGSAVAAVAVIVVFAFVVYAGYRVIRKWGSPSRGESD